MDDGRKFAVFDIDGTLIRWQLYHSIADTLAKLGHIDPKLQKSIKDARMVWKRRAGDFNDYERQLIAVYDQVIQQMSMEQFQAAANAVFEEYKDQTYTYTRDLIAKLKSKKYKLFAISGSQREIVAKIAAYHGFDDYVGSRYEFVEGRFTGQKDVVATYKDKALKELVNKYGLDYAGSIAVGDSQSDIAMMELVEQPIAFNPEKHLFSAAKARHWRIVIERKNMVYELEWREGHYELVAPN
jgi:HAD superfamily hydrolase (TIGR01490 family)